jgi:hypothetical protein
MSTTNDSTATPRTDKILYGEFRNHEGWKVHPFVNLARQLESELNDALAWKESASIVMNKIDLQAVGKALNVPLGRDISSAILPGITALQATVGPLVKSLRDTLFAARNADETGYVTDVGFLDVGKIHENADKLIAQFDAAQGKKEGGK